MATAKEIRQLFIAQGLSVAAWSRERGFPAPLVYRVLRGETDCLRGKSHEIGVALGIKAPLTEDQHRQISDGCVFKQGHAVRPK